MTKKDYIALAAALLRSCPYTTPLSNEERQCPKYNTWAFTVVAVVTALAADNVHFNRQRFYAACGYSHV